MVAVLRCAEDGQHVPVGKKLEPVHDHLMSLKRKFLLPFRRKREAIEAYSGDHVNTKVVAEALNHVFTENVADTANIVHETWKERVRTAFWE